MLLTFKFQTPSSTTFLFNILARQLINHLTYSCCISKFTTFRHSPCYVFLQIELECFLIEWLMVGWGSASIESNYAFCFIFFSIYSQKKQRQQNKFYYFIYSMGGDDNNDDDYDCDALMHHWATSLQGYLKKILKFQMAISAGEMNHSTSSGKDRNNLIEFWNC